LTSVHFNHFLRCVSASPRPDRQVNNEPGISVGGKVQMSENTKRPALLLPSRREEGCSVTMFMENKFILSNNKQSLRLSRKAHFHGEPHVHQ
jgi:hypothetical protein